MGGQKKRPLAREEKSQATKVEKDDPSKKFGMHTQPKALIVPEVDGPEVARVLKGMKAVTLYRTAKALGVNASIAAALLKTLESKNVIQKRGGFSGHSVWSVV